MIYVIVRNDGMTRRSMEVARGHAQAQNVCIRNVAGKSATQQITDAKTLFDTSTINEEEFQATIGTVSSFVPTDRSSATGVVRTTGERPG